MNDQMLRGFFANEGDPYAVILGVNEIASAIAVRLCWEGCRVVMSHDPFPPVIRREMSFHDALFDDRAEVDGIVGQRADTTLEIIATLAQRARVAVTTQPLTDLITLRRPDLVVDARMQKQQVTPDLRGVTRLAVDSRASEGHAPWQPHHKVWLVAAIYRPTLRIACICDAQSSSAPPASHHA